MLRLVAILVGLTATLTEVRTAAAAPSVEIKATSSLSLERVRLLGDGEVEVTGFLLDKLTNEGIADQQLEVVIGGQRVRAETGPDGRFRAVARDIPPGAQPVELQFAGKGPVDRAELRTTTDPARAQVTLAIAVEDAPGGAAITVTATVDDQPAALPIQLALGAPTDVQLAPLGAPVTAGTPFTLTRARANGPGPRRIRATYPGDPTRQAATAEATLELTTATTTTLALAGTSLAYEDDVVATGTVVDEDGRPVPRAAVTLTAGDRRLAQGATSDAGSYRFAVEAEILGQGQFGLQVQTDPVATSVRASRSAPVIVRVAAPQPVPVSYTIAAFLATALAAGGFFAARTKPWRRLRRAAAPAEASAAAVAAAPADGGLVLNRPGIAATLRRASDDGFSGVVRDTVRGRPVAAAVVRLLLDDSERELRTGADGSFSLERLAPGEWRAEIAAPGHVTERFAVSIPHRGELRGVRIDLVPVRERVFQLYRRAAEPALPEARLWGIWSPRQIVDHVRRGRPSPALGELTDFVEEVYFSPRIAAESVLDGAAERVDHAVRERTRTAS